MLKLITKSVINFCTKTPSNIPSMSQVKHLRKARYDGRTKKRKWEERRTDKGEAFDLKRSKPEKDAEKGPNADRIKRRKFAVIMGYSGVNYFGMQRNPHTRTIEEEFFQALHKTETINDECFSQVQNMQFQRAARTDKGVSAARQVVSLKLPEQIDLVKINEHLPEVIRVFGVKRVTKGFNSKTQCDGRTYFYMFPTIVFAPDLDTVNQEEYRVDKDTFEKLNRVLEMFVGTKNFHNFTAKRKPNDPSSTRYIKSFLCEEPFVRKCVEFAVMKVRGQSFMLHQIRKMIGLTIAIMRNQATEDIMNKAFSIEKLSIPRAPGLGLVLDQVHYDRYNFRYGEDGMHEKLTWEEIDSEINEFKEKHIYPTIIDTEINEKAMVYWIQNKLSKHSYDDDDESKNDESDNEGENEDDNVEESLDNDSKEEETVDNKANVDDKNDSKDNESKRVSM